MRKNKKCKTRLGNGEKIFQVRSKINRFYGSESDFTQRDAINQYIKDTYGWRNIRKDAEELFLQTRKRRFWESRKKYQEKCLLFEEIVREICISSIKYYQDSKHLHYLKDHHEYEGEQLWYQSVFDDGYCPSPPEIWD